MNLRARLKRLFAREQRKTTKRSAFDVAPPELREFVYLDEVSLRSLLSSLKGGVTDSTSEHLTEGVEAALAATVGASTPLIAKAEVVSRYQTSNSSTIQTSRKATVQSWFRELHEVPDIRLVRPVTPTTLPKTIDELIGIRDESLVARTDDLRRGRLVEFRVRLSADPVFHLGTMVSEFTAMADDYPEMFASGNALANLQQVQPINKILHRLLAGLIPIRAIAIDYEVVEIGGEEYVVHRDLKAKLTIAGKPLVLVGVTEHEAYWKDLRRVLFSDAEFTVLARLARPGLHDTWTPVKLADLFAELTPGLVDQINAVSRGAFSTVPTNRAPTAEVRLSEALGFFAKALAEDCGGALSEDQENVVRLEIELLKTRASSASDQRAAFAAVAARVAGYLGAAPTPDRALELREEARASAGLSLFPGLAAERAGSQTTVRAEARHERLLDVDVVAIYW